MSKTIALLLTGALSGAALTAGVFAAQHETDEATREAIVAVKAAVVQAYLKKDAAALDQIYGDDYTAIDAAGTLRTKQDELRSVTEEGGDALIGGQYDIVAVRRWGDFAVANGQGALTWRSPSGETRQSNYYSFNVFERRDGRWVYVAAFLP